MSWGLCRGFFEICGRISFPSLLNLAQALPVLNASDSKQLQIQARKGKLTELFPCESKSKLDKTPAQAFTSPADEKKMSTIWIFVYYAVYGSGRGRCRDFLVLKWGGGLNLQIWDLNRARETERTVFPILQVFSMCRCKL